MAELKNEQCDVIVVGGGSAAFEAAVACKQAGAKKVVMLEKAPEFDFGGNARYSHTGFRFAHSGPQEIREFVQDVPADLYAKMHIEPYSTDDFYNDLMRVTQGRMDKELTRTLVNESNAAVHWMLECGIKWQPEGYVIIDGHYYFEPGVVIHPAGGEKGGLYQVMRWREIALGLGVDLRYESRVSAIHGNAREVAGVEVTTPEASYNLYAPAVILAAGGFQASAEMRARYLVPNADLMKVRGSMHDTGEVMMMAIAMGAKTSGHWRGAHATPIDSTFPMDFELSNEANRYRYPFGITVNMQGQRFFDEGESQQAYTYAKTGWAMMTQPGGVGYQIYDKKLLALIQDQYYQHATPIVADSIAELAKKIGVNVTVFEREIEAYNKAVRDDVPFDPAKHDGKCTTGLAVNKSNWATKMDEPPFHAYPVTGGITFTFGGIKVNSDAQVVNTSDQPIKNLYATGDILGLFFHNYPAMTGQTRNAVFARLAAKHIFGVAKLVAQAPLQRA